MHVRRVKVRNVRAFREVDVDLTRADGEGCAGWTVIAGRNGSGKTTLLQALSLGLTGGDSVFAIDASGDGWVAEDAVDAAQSYEVGRADEDRVPDPLDLFHHTQEYELDATRPDFALLSAMKTVTFDWQWEERQPDGMARRRAWGDPASERTTWLMDWCLTSAESRGWFACGYGAFRRRFGHAAELAQQIQPYRKRAAFATLFREDQALVECTQWLKDTHLRALDKNDDTLRALRDDALRLLNDGLMPDGVTLTRVDSDGLWARRAGGSEALFDRLSSGFRVVASLVLDVIAQMQRAFGALRVEAREGGLVVPHSGVVLIDEVEEHLHPEWQQRIGFWLKRHFPNVQFVVTTHSPFVCQAADLLVRLHPDGGGAWAASRASEKTHAAVVNGTIDDAAMSDLFGVERVYSERTEKLRDEVAALEVKALRGQASPEESQRLQELSAKMPSNDTSVIEQSLRKLVKMQ